MKARPLAPALLAGVMSACATYSPPPVGPVSPPRVEAGAVIATSAGPRAHTVAALLARRGELRVRFEGDLRGRLQELAGAARIPLRRADALVGEALRRASKLDLDGARAALAEARALLPEVPAGAEEIDAWAMLQTAGAVLALLDEHSEQALRLLRGVTAVRPSFVPPASVTPPEAVALLRRAQVESDAAPRMTVEIHSSPAGAEIIVDGTPRGRSPVRLELPQGTHFVTAAALGLRASPRRMGESPEEIVRLALAPASSAIVAADALQELERPQMTPLALRLTAMALEVEHLALLDGNEVLIWNADAPATMSPIRESSEGSRSAQDDALAALIATRWEPTPPAIGAVTVSGDTGQDTPWYRRWWGWVVAVLATGISLSIVR